MDEVRDSFKRKIKEIKELETNVYFINFTAAITKQQLDKHYPDNLVFTSMKKNTEAKCSTSDTYKENYFINFLKTQFENHGIPIDDLFKLSKDDFFKYYKPVALKPILVKAINEYYQSKKEDNMKAEFDDVEWKPFQKTIIDICNTKPDNRIIYLIEDIDGNCGKSYTCKYLNLHYKCIIAEGKKDNIFNQLLKMMENGSDPDLVLLDIPRQGENYLQYGVIEQLKNGLVYSGKYEGGVCQFEYPHVFIFTNFRVNTELWTKDRIRYIDASSGEVSTYEDRNVY